MNSELMNSVATELQNTDEILAHVSARRTSPPVRWEAKTAELSEVLTECPRLREFAVRVRETHDGSCRISVFAAPHTKYAPTFNGKKRFVLPNGLAVLCPDENDASIWYERIFENRVYLRSGISVLGANTIVDLSPGIGLFALFAIRIEAKASLYLLDLDANCSEFLRANVEIYASNARLRGTTEPISEDYLRHFMNSENLSSVDLLKWDVADAQRAKNLTFKLAEWAGIRQVVLRLPDQDSAMRVRLALKDCGYDAEIGSMRLPLEPPIWCVYGTRADYNCASGRANEAALESSPVPADERVLSESEIRGFLMARISSLPALEIKVLEALPRDASGAIDEQSLTALQIQKRLAPNSPTEQALFDIWAEVLEFRDFGVEDDFLELGGDSLQATKVISRIRDVFNVDLPLAIVFTDSLTVSYLALMIERIRFEED